MNIFDFFNSDFNKILKSISNENTWSHSIANPNYETNSNTLVNEVVKDLEVEYGKGTMETVEVVMKKTIMTWTSEDGKTKYTFALYSNGNVDTTPKQKSKEQEAKDKQKTIDNLKNQLAQAISKEEFELAAQLRDNIYKLSKP